MSHEKSKNLNSAHAYTLNMCLGYMYDLNKTSYKEVKAYIMGLDQLFPSVFSM